MCLTHIYFQALSYLWQRKIKTSAIVLANILLAIASVAEPVLFGRIIDSISKQQTTLIPLITWTGFALFSTVATVALARAADRMAHTTRAAMLTGAYERFIAMPVSWHSARGASNVFHTLARASDTLFSLWLEFLRSHLSLFVSLALLVPAAMTVNVKLAATLGILGLAYWGITAFVMSKTKAGQKQIEGHYHTVFSHMSDTISNVSVLQSYNRVAAEAQTLRTYIDDLLQAQLPVLDWWALASALNRMAATISMMVVLTVSITLVKDGNLTVGDVVTFVGFSGMLIGKLDQIKGFVSQIFDARVKLEEFYQLDIQARELCQADEGTYLNTIRGKVEFKNVSFLFPNSQTGLRDISFSAEPGQTIAIVGPTGAGKTTLINLLMRNLDPQEGQILIDGVDVMTVSKSSIRDRIASVFQDTGLLNRTILQNIRIGRSDASVHDIKSAARAAAADFIERREGGYDSLVGDRGSRLSGGERQRIAIARALIKNAPILVLDEATSALDVETEAAVKLAIDNAARDRTTFIIAHRLSTIQGADVVLFMDDGKIVEAGPYAHLQQRGGRFTRLLQAGGIVSQLPATAALPLEAELA